MAKYYKPRIGYINWFRMFGDANIPPTVIVSNPPILFNKHITDKNSIHSKAVNKYFKQHIKSHNRRGK